MGSLTASRKPATMAQAPIRPDFHQSFDIEGGLFSKIAFNAVLLFNDLADLVCFVIVEVANLRIQVHAGTLQDLVRLSPSDAENVSQSDLDPFIRREIDACYTGHFSKASNIIPVSVYAWY